MRRIAALYAVEVDLRGQPPDVRRARREAHSQPLVKNLFAWLEEQLARAPGRGDLAEAIRYALKSRNGLTWFLTTAASTSTPTPSSAPSDPSR